jgi:hypothetical protein
MLKKWRFIQKEKEKQKLRETIFSNIFFDQTVKRLVCVLNTLTH